MPMWPFRKRSRSGEAQHALEDAERSEAQAEADLIRLSLKAVESHEVARKLRQHNLSNHYDSLVATFLERAR